ncbi:ATP-binding protein, partial [Streptomyces sp. DfronAA-171]
LRGRTAALERLLAPQGPPVRLLTGEAGVGKTRLAGEVARRASEAGTAVLWGSGHDAEGHTPYGAFAEALDGWLAEHTAAERAGVGAEYPELASFLPSLGRPGKRAGAARRRSATASSGRARCCSPTSPPGAPSSSSSTTCTPPTPAPSSS